LPSIAPFILFVHPKRRKEKNGDNYKHIKGIVYKHTRTLLEQHYIAAMLRHNISDSRLLRTRLVFDLKGALLFRLVNSKLIYQKSETKNFNVSFRYSPPWLRYDKNIDCRENTLNSRWIHICHQVVLGGIKRALTTPFALFWWVHISSSYWCPFYFCRVGGDRCLLL
jgi:hypothetical protein